MLKRLERLKNSRYYNIYRVLCKPKPFFILWNNFTKSYFCLPFERFLPNHLYCVYYVLRHVLQS